MELVGLLGRAISSVQRIRVQEPTIAEYLDKALVEEAIQSGDEKSIIFAVIAGTALQKRALAEIGNLFEEGMLAKVFNEITNDFLLPGGSLDKEKLLQVSKKLPSEEARELLLLGVENCYLERQLLDFYDKGELETKPCKKVIKRLEETDPQIIEIAAKLDPNTLLPKN